MGEDLDTEWEKLTEEVQACQACGLCRGRSRAVLGEGNPSAALMFIGEGPGAEEDRQGRPFVGPAGQLLDRMLDAIHISRADVYIANIVKCRPPENRNPTDDEAKACLPYLRRQVKLVSPRILVCLGTTAAKHIIDPEARVSRDRGRWHERRGYSILATYHPAALLRRDEYMIDTWRDLKLIEAKLRQIGQEATDAGE